MDGFKFEIGTIVITKCGFEQCMAAARGGEMLHPIFGMIVARIQDECTGGVQRHYHVSVNSNGVGAIKANEIELVATAELDLEPLYDLHRAIRKEREARLWEREDRV
jgi:hypothetical protein